MLLDLRLSGVASLSDRVAMTALLDRLAHELRHLDVDAEALITRPTLEDVAAIDVRGALGAAAATLRDQAEGQGRSEEHTSELQSLMRISYAVICLKKKQ